MITENVTYFNHYMNCIKLSFLHWHLSIVANVFFINAYILYEFFDKSKTDKFKINFSFKGDKQSKLLQLITKYSYYYIIANIILNA